MTTDLDKVITSDPVDRTAAIVTSKGVQYDNPKRIVQRHWETAPAILQVERGEHDLRGLTFGRFTVVGKFQRKSGGKPALWLVRCACSHYETRRAKAINNPSNKGDCCDRCRQLLYAKRDRHRRSTGEDVEWDHFA